MCLFWAILSYFGHSEPVRIPPEPVRTRSEPVRTRSEPVLGYFGLFLQSARSRSPRICKAALRTPSKKHQLDQESNRKALNTNVHIRKGGIRMDTSVRGVTDLAVKKRIFFLMSMVSRPNLRALTRIDMSVRGGYGSGHP